MMPYTERNTLETLEKNVTSEKIKNEKRAKRGMILLIILLALCTLLGLIGLLVRIISGDGFAAAMINLFQFKVTATEDYDGQYFVIEGGVRNEDYIYANDTLVVLTSTPLTISTRGTMNGMEQIHVMVKDGEANLIFHSVSINTSMIDNSYAVLVSEGGLNLYYYGDNEIISGAYKAGVESDCFPLTITAMEETAKLTVAGGYMAAGIGGGADQYTGNIVIEGGNLTVVGGKNGAGIGAGSGGYCEGIEIRGANIKVSGGYGGAGIGGGNAGETGKGSVGRILISSSNVTALGGSSGAGIGGGYAGDTNEVFIENSVVNVSSEAYGAGIGGGNHGIGRNIVLTDSYVTALGGEYGAGIGGGYITSGEYITVLRSEVIASGGKYGAGIGGGFQGCGIHISISGDSSVYAWAGEQAAGIGSGCNVALSEENVVPATAIAEELHFSDSLIYAVGGYSGAGIGGGNCADVNQLEIVNCEVVCLGGEYGAGIGGGNYGNAKNMVISQSDIEATAGIWGAGIGGGYNGALDGINISASRVHAIGGDDSKYPAAGGAGIGGGDSGNADHIMIYGSTIDSVSLGYGASIGAGGRGGKPGQVMIAGGSVKAVGANSIGDGLYQRTIPVNEDGRELFVVPVELIGMNREVRVLKLNCLDDLGYEYTYDCANVLTDQSGIAYFYLPENFCILSVETENGNFQDEEGAFYVTYANSDVVHGFKRDKEVRKQKDVLESSLSIAYQIEDKVFYLTEKEIIEAMNADGTQILLPGVTPEEQMISVVLYGDNEEILTGQTVALKNGLAEVVLKSDSVKYHMNFQVMSCNAGVDSIVYEIDGKEIELSGAELALAAGNQGVSIKLPEKTKEDDFLLLQVKTKDATATVDSKSIIYLEDGHATVMIRVSAQDRIFTKNYIVSFYQ